MVAFPTVKSFCCCCELRVPCIVVALLRMVLYIIGVLAYLYFFVVLDMIFKVKKNRRYTEEQVALILRVLFFVSSVNVFVTVLFVIGAKVKNPAKMEYYLIVVGLNALLFMFLFNWILSIIAVIECYILLCSYSLYNEYVSAAQENAVNVVYTTVNTVITNEMDPPPQTQYNKINTQEQMA